MDLPRQPGTVRILVTSEHPDDIFRAVLSIRRVLENHYASTNEYTNLTGGYVIDCYPFAVND